MPIVCGVFIVDVHHYKKQCQLEHELHGYKLKQEQTRKEIARLRGEKLPFSPSVEDNTSSPKRSGVPVVLYILASAAGIIGILINIL